MKLDLHDYQKEAIDFLLSRNSGALFADPGLGKTIITLKTLQALRLYYGRLRVLISAPKRVIYNVWPEEIDKWDGINFSFDILHGPKKSVAKNVEIQLINPEGLQWLCSHKRLPAWDVLIVDESSQYKSPSSVRFKKLKRLLRRFKHRYILSGTPMPNSYMDLWSQIYILDLGKNLGEKITYYRDSYFYAVKDGDYYDWRLVPGMDEIIDRRIAPLALRLDADKYLDLPGLTSNDIKVKLPPNVEKEYKSMVRKLYAEIDGKKVYAKSATEKYHICRDMLSGAKYVQEGSREYIVIHNEKLNALEEFISELQGKPVIVAYERWHEHDRIQARFGGNLPAVNSKTSTSTMAQIQHDWNNGKIPILLVHPAALSHGLNLQRGGHDLVWFCGATENYEFYEQLQRRLYRQGVQRPVRVHHIVVPGSLDMVVLARLRSKKLRQMRVFDAIKAYRDNQSSFSS